MAQKDSINTETGRPILIIESDRLRKTISLNSKVFSIGRHPKCSLTIDDKIISRHHATIAWLRDNNKSDKYAYWIIDGKGQRQRSTNGILVNGTPTMLHRLRSGDVISLGSDTNITYSYIADTTENIQIQDVVYYL